ncbi:universal stress protein [Phenylobacterium sp.]|uniref:universal stress protein n=1 Tax=Phenylobacterium sp. TaxID=1871053 RepID=UPI002FE18B09
MTQHMMDQSATLVPPRKILLATDLSGRGDRALDRATQLAGQWDAELTVVHAIEGAGLDLPEHKGLPSWRGPPDPVAYVERQIREDVRGPCPRLRVIVEEGPAIQVILATMEREAADLVVIGLGRNRAFGIGGVGRTVHELFRRSPASVLVVKRRPNGPYQHLLVGVDFSPESRCGLEMAGRLLPDAAMAVMHAYELPYRGYMLDTPLGRDFGELESSTLRRFLDEADLRPEQRQRIFPLIEHGPPEAMIAAYVMERGADLTVIGAHERRLLFHMVIGGNGPRIIDTAPSDVLVVRAERPQD